MWNQFRHVLAVVSLAAFVGACGKGSVEEAGSVDYVVDRMQARLEAATWGEPWYRTLDELLPNMKYRERGKSEIRGSDLMIVGEIVDVEAGYGFKVTERDFDGKRVDFDDPGALWKTVHLKVAVAKHWGRSSPELVTVGFGIDGDDQLPQVRDGLRGLGMVALFLQEKTPHYSYDPSIYGIAKGGHMVATVAADGALALPFLDDQEEAMLLKGVGTMEALERHANGPERVGTIVREQGRARRAA